MTTTTSPARWLYIDGKGHGLINGKKELAFDLPRQWNIGELEYAFREACLKHNHEIPVDEEELHRILRDAVKSFGKRNVEHDPGDGDGKAENGRKAFGISADLSAQEQAFQLAEYLKTEFTFKTMNDSREVYYYDPGAGKYVARGERLIEIRCAELVPGIRTAVVNEATEMIKRTTPAERAEFDKDIFILNLQNGLLDIGTGQLEEHRPGHLSLAQLPVTFHPSKSCPAFRKFLRETLEPDNIEIITKLLGYLLYKKAIYHKAFVFCGEGSNGKSTLINAIEAFIGKENRSTVSLQDLTKNRFAKAELHGKLANLFADIPAEKIVNTGDFKMLVSGDPIGAERKHQHRFTFENTAKLIFSANQIPRTDDESYAYYRRLVIIPFTRVFEGEEIDQHLLEKLTTADELSGILNLALKGLKKLQAERGFQEANMEEIKKQYELGASRIKEFLQQECIMEPGNEVLFEDSARLREAYRQYCRGKGTKYFDERKFGEELKALGIVHKRKGGRKSRAYFDFGIKLKDELYRALEAQVPPSLDKTLTFQLIGEDSTIQKEIAGDPPGDGGTE